MIEEDFVYTAQEADQAQTWELWESVKFLVEAKPKRR